MQKKIPVAVLAATGSVGQRFVSLLADHPWFELMAVTGSDRSIGKSYQETCKWLLADPMPENARNLKVLPSSAEDLGGIPIVFSGLPTDTAKEVEPYFARAGMAVFSNASAYRKEEDVPILLPEVNADHLSILQAQRKHHGWSGSIVTNPNCTSTGMTVVLKAIQQSFGLSKVFAVSMQALSGAGYPGVASLDIIDNVIPNIQGEEDKVEWEPRKMLGKILNDQFGLADMQISAHTNRVAVSDGHMVCLSVECSSRPTVEDMIRVLSTYLGPEDAQHLPSAPKPVILVKHETDRPQPRLDRLTGNGMTTVVGRIRVDPLFHIKMVILSHNTIRGAAGGSIFNAELFARQQNIIS